MDIFNAEIVDTTSFSYKFPNEKIEKKINRANYIVQIKSELNTNNVLFIEGEEDSGKSTLLADFAKAHSSNSVTVFFNPLNNLDFQTDYFFENINAQLEFIFNNEKEVSSHTSSSDAVYRNLLFQLRKKFKNSNEKFYIIIDGLENNFEKSRDFIIEIVESLPLGDNFIKIILTGSQIKFTDNIPILKKSKHKNLTVLGFNTTEIEKFLNIDDHDYITQILKITKGFPGRLQTTRRLLNYDYTIEELLQDENYTTWINLDCEKIDLTNEKVEVILSIISLSSSSYKLSDLSIIIEIEESKCQQIINEIPILEIGESVKFVSISHKNYFANRLRNNKDIIQELLIKYYTDSQTINSKYELFKLFSENGNWSKVQEIISESFIVGLIENTGSLQKVSDSLETGYTASSNLKNYTALFRYSIIGSIVNELDSYTFWESEILARLAINDYTGAIGLAQSAVLKVDRLRLFALIAKNQKETNKSVSDELTDLIKELYKETDLSEVGNNIYDIVSNLIYALPSLAIEIIDKSSASDNSNNSINDLIIAKLSFAAITSGETDSEETKKVEAINRLNNPSAKKINRAISFLVKNYTSTKVLQEVNKLKDSTEKIKLLRLWLFNNKYDINDLDREKIINFSIDEVINSSTDVTVNYEILQELSSQLPLIKNFDIKSKILKRFRILEKDINNIGQIKDKIKYDLNIFHTQYTLSSDKSILIINDIIKEIENYGDLLIKAECYSEVYSKLFYISNKDILKKKFFVKHKTLELCEELQIKSANHYKVFLNIIKTLSPVDPVMSLDIISNLNTMLSRNRLRFMAADKYLENTINKIDFTTLKTIQYSFESKRFKEYFVKLILERLYEAKTLPREVIQNLLFFTNEIKNFEINPNSKIFCLLIFYKVVAKNDYWKNQLSNGIKAQINVQFEKIDSDWEKIDLGYIICSELANIDKQFSREKFDVAETIKKNTWIDSELIARIYVNTIALTINAFEGILINKAEIENEFRIIEQLVSSIPSELEKITLWTQLSITAYLNNKLDFSKKVYDKHILPIFPTLVSKGVKIDDTLETLILLHIYNNSLAIETIKKLPYLTREESCIILSDFYLKKKNPYHYYEGEILNHSVTLQDIYNAISVLELSVMDTAIFEIIDSISKTEVSKNLTKIQITDIVTKLNDIIAKKLPDTKNIQHNGYKIISQLKVELIGKSHQNWKSIIEDAENLENVSDRLFVKSVLLDNIPFNKVNVTNKKKLFDDVVKDLHSLPSNYEFVDRVSQISDNMFKLERVEWKKVIDKAFLFSKDIEEGTEAYKFQKNMIDSIYRVDESIAKDLINSIDKENSDFKQGKVLRRHYETLEISNKIKNNKTIQQKEQEDFKILLNGIKKTLGSVNAGKTNVKKIDEVVKYLFIGYKVPLMQAIHLYNYYFTNCSKMQLTKNSINEYTKIHERNFQEMVDASNLIQILSRKRKLDMDNNRKVFIQENFTNNFVSNPGTREEALNYIRDWMLENVEEFLLIVDPYFHESDLEILKYTKEFKDLTIDILASKEFANDDQNTKIKYLEYWKIISDEEPPITNITFCWVPEDNKNTPFHDRCIISKNGGLRIGTSFRSLGLKKDSEISIISSEEAKKICNLSLNGFLTRRTKYSNSMRIHYEAFSI